MLVASAIRVSKPSLLRRKLESVSCLSFRCGFRVSPVPTPQRYTCGPSTALGCVTGAAAGGRQLLAGVRGRGRGRDKLPALFGRGG